MPPKGAPTAAEVTGRLLDVLLRADGQDTLRLMVRPRSPWLRFLGNKRVQRTLATFPVRPCRNQSIRRVCDFSVVTVLAALDPLMIKFGGIWSTFTTGILTP